MKNTATKKETKVIHKGTDNIKTAPVKKWNPGAKIPAVHTDKKYRRIADIKTTVNMKTALAAIKSQNKIDSVAVKFDTTTGPEFVVNGAKGVIALIPVTADKTMISFYVGSWAMTKPNRTLKSLYEGFKSAGSNLGKMEFCRVNPYAKEDSPVFFNEKILGFLAPEPADVPDDELD